ncbi:MAG: hypothetical protein KKF98_07925 [Bacteroidetes bacterium]|nr:hypothetical protein [Bacteroidota bacterium]
MVNRRTFLKKVLRNITFGAMAVGSGYLLLKEESGASCTFDFVCRNCKKLTTCGLPQAGEFIKNELNVRK